MIEHKGMYHVDNDGQVKLCKTPETCLLSPMSEHYSTKGEAFDNKDYILSSRFGVLSSVDIEGSSITYKNTKMDKNELIKVDTDDIPLIISELQNHISVWIETANNYAVNTNYLNDSHEKYSKVFESINEFNNQCEQLDHNNEILEYLISNSEEVVAYSLSTYIYEITPFMLPVSRVNEEPDIEAASLVNEEIPNHNDVLYNVLNANLNYRKSVTEMYESVVNLSEYIILNVDELFVADYGELRTMYFNMNKLNEELQIRNKLMGLGYVGSFEYYNGEEFASNLIRVDEGGTLINAYGVNHYGVVGKLVDVEIDGESQYLVDENNHKYSFTRKNNKTTNNMRVYIDNTEGREFSMPNMLFETK